MASRKVLEGKRIAIVGGGLAGLATAATLSEHIGEGGSIDLFEARRTLGGRAGSFVDAATGERIDHCQHVGMGCCTNLADFFRRMGAGSLFERHDVLHFFAPDGRRFDLSAARWLPAPLHLGPSLLRMGFLNFRERWGIARAMLRLARVSPAGKDRPVGQWLRERGQSERAIERFWAVVLVGALGEEIDRCSLLAARKVFVDGFMSHRDGYRIDVPLAPLGAIYDRIAEELGQRGVQIRLGSRVTQVAGGADGVSHLVVDGARQELDYAVIAIPWQRAAEIPSPELLPHLPELSAVKDFESSPISAVHLWFDREITELPHAVLVGRLSQWLFRRGRRASSADGDGEEYVQVVISASRQLADRPRDEVVDEVLTDLQAVFPACRDARLLRHRLVTQREAVFSYAPGLDRFRPSQRTPVRNLFLAGDWTRTGWPSTMEGAVRSGYLAVEGVLSAAGIDARLLAPDLRRGSLARWICG